MRITSLREVIASAPGAQVLHGPEGLTVYASPSKAAPGRVNIAVFAPQEEMVQAFLDKMGARGWLIPVRCADGVWCSMGRAH